MSDRRSPAARAVDALVAEAREHLDVRGDEVAPSPNLAKKDTRADIDWARLEARVMAATVEKPVRAAPRPRGSGGRDVLLRGGALLFAAAAAVALFVRRPRDDARVDGPAVAEGREASSLRATEGAGEVRVGGVRVTAGHVVRGGDLLEVGTARAVLERPGKVSWLLEQADPAAGSGARARVTAAGEPLVLALDNGAIEAQVVPVATGEAFAVDIATDRGVVRVAVHGTHLRVARAGDRVVVDLTEGVVSIGVPPRTGMTHGTVVTAPAHVELDATDLGTLRVDRAPSSVRVAIPLGPQAALAEGPGRSDPAGLPGPSLQQLPLPPKGGGPAPSEAPAVAKVEPRKAALPPREAIAAGVRECAAARARTNTGSVHVTLTSDLHLRVGADGTVESAQFSPPLLPEIQSCAAQVIYKTKLDRTGEVTIPIEFSY